MLPVDVLANLPAVLRKPVGWFLEMPDKDSLAPDEIEIVALYRGCTKDTRVVILESLRAGYKQAQGSAG